MSSINPNNINGSYPIAGQDNDSQGFRDNFTNVKNNLTFAKTEIEDLQKNVILKVALAGTTSDDPDFNNMNNALLKSAQLVKAVEKFKDLGPQATTVVSFADGHYQRVTTISGTPLIISAFTAWPTSLLYAKLRLEVNIINPATDTLTLPTLTGGDQHWIGLNVIQGAVGRTITFLQAGSYVFEFSTYNHGDDITIRDLSRNADKIYGDLTINGNLTLLSTKEFIIGVDLVGETFVPSATAQFFSNIAGYSQVNQQNISANAWASSDFIATSNNGNDSQGFIDMGINSNTYSQSTFTIASANDGYLYTFGNATTGGGNLAIGTATANDVVFFTGGTLAANEAARISGNGTKNLTVAGNLISAGGRVDSGYQYSAATNDFNDTVGVTTARVIYDPAATLAKGTITLPAGNVDAKIVTVSSTQDITAFKVNPSVGTTLVPSANITLAAGTSATYFYHLAETKWYKIG